MKKLLKYSTIPLLCLLLIIVSLISYLSINEYRPAAIEPLIPIVGKETIDEKQSLSIATYNIGYGGLSATEDFFMDGGTNVQPPNKKFVQTNLAAIAQTLQQANADIHLLQEVDRQSKRSYYIDEENYFQEKLNTASVFAYNFLVDFVPIPVPPIGRVASGLATFTDYQMTQANRISLPVPFKWPIRLSNLKRSLLETRFPIAGSDKELVIFNLHLEAYDSGEGRMAQSKKLAQLLAKEYAKGNYVIAGGDFNQTFEGSHQFPTVSKDIWQAGTFTKKDLPEHFSFSYDDTYPTVRVLNDAYTGDYETSQVYVIDGFIVSDNVKVEEIQTQNTDFKATDHHLVKLTITFS
jgi:endonuclease/exonuclease/phosphatase family metal-dependent hydrolase